jgi:precorrin-2 dehydrogenase / sirohydrochlorin ferrochelatase
MTTLIPFFLDLSQKRVLLVGGGSVALDKLRQLLPTDARIDVVTLHANPTLKSLVRAHPDRVRMSIRAFQPSDLDDQDLVIGATNDARTNRRLAEAAKARGIWINAVDDPPSCDAIMASTLRRGPFVVAVGTEGRFPGLARAVRRFLDRALPEQHADELERLAHKRQLLKEQLPSLEQRGEILRGLVQRFEREYLQTLS